MKEPVIASPLFNSSAISHLAPLTAFFDATFFDSGAFFSVTAKAAVFAEGAPEAFVPDQGRPEERKKTYGRKKTNLINKKTFFWGGALIWFFRVDVFFPPNIFSWQFTPLKKKLA